RQKVPAGSWGAPAVAERGAALPPGGGIALAGNYRSGGMLMHGVLIEVDVGGVGRDEGLKSLRQQTVPAITALPGFHSGTWLTGNESGLGLSLTVWDTKEHAQAM